jgi:nucleobase:cation symporter-1, NCS1 family
VLTRVPQRVLVLASVALSTVGALAIDLGSYTTFLSMLGSFFVPLFGVLLADWLVAGASYGSREIFGAPAVRPGMVAAWLAGFALYQWLLPQGPGWWVDLIGRLDPPSLSIGATLPSFALSFAAAAALALVARRARPASVPA